MTSRFPLTAQWCALLISVAAPVSAQSPAIADPPADSAYPARLAEFVLPSHGEGMNAIMYIASGANLHPTLVLLHGFPGNEPNLDLAQAARRAGWNVLIFHYRGSWASGGDFSFLNAAEDTHVALAYLRDPANFNRLKVDPRRIAVAGHSMGGYMAADAAADDPGVIGLFLIDPWNIGATARELTTADGLESWRQDSARDIVPLAGTSWQKLADEMKANVDRFDLTKRAIAFGPRPLDIIGATRGAGAAQTQLLSDVKAAGNPLVTGVIWPTDHSFSDHRIALSEELVRWLGTLPVK